MRPGARPGRVAAVGAAALLGGALSVATWGAGGVPVASEDSEFVRPPAPVAARPQPVVTGPSPPPHPAPAVAARPATLPRVPPESQRAPTFIHLPGGHDMALRPVGVIDGGHHRGEMEIPDDPRVGGWYRFGAAPGDPTGAVVVAAHADRSGQGRGPLSEMDRLEPGAQIRLDVGRRRFLYRVDRVLTVPKDRLDPAALFADGGSPRLHLVSCGGAFDAEAHRYSANIVATATLVR